MKTGNILVLLYFHTDTCINVINSRKENSVFSHVATYNGFKCSNVIFERNVAAEMACTSMCLRRTDCVGVHYSRTTTLCTGCGPLLDVDHETTADTKYFHKCGEEAISGEYDGSTYTVYAPRTKFITAKSCCSIHRNSSLVHFDNRPEEWFVNGLATQASVERYYIGLKYDKTDSKWKWEDDNTEATFTDWGYKQPDSSYQHCVIMSIPYGGKWYDYDCYYRQPCACEKRIGL